MNFSLNALQRVVYILTALLFDCASSRHERPPGVASGAEWAGGIDGGDWIYCTLDNYPSFNKCDVYNEFTGELEMSGEFILKSTRQAAAKEELLFRHADVANNVIQLYNEKTLEKR